MKFVKESIAEFIGTFALMFVGGGAIVMTAAMPEGGGGLIAIALAHGLILSVMVSATLHISGGQFNPAVSIALALVRVQPWSRALIFMTAQIVGACIAAFLLSVLLDSVPVANGIAPAVDVVKVGATLGAMNLDAGVVFALETIATFFLMFVIMGSGVDNRGVGKSFSVGGFAIGLTVAANILFFGPLTGASMNPARSFGPALVASAWTMHWVYWAAPVCGATIAATVYQAAFAERKPVP